MTTTNSNIGALSNYFSTGAAAISESIAPGDGYRLVSVMVHLSAAPTSAGNVTVTLNSGAGSAYDTLLNSQSLVGVTDYVWLPSNKFMLVSGDAVDVAYTNTDTKTYGMTLTLENV